MRNISYPYGDSNVFLVLAALLHVRGNISYPYGDSNHRNAGRVCKLLRNISYPYGDSNLRGHTSAHSPPKHLIPLWGQQLEKLRQRRVAVSAKHFIPLWGQQQSSDSSRPPQSGNISYPYGDSNVEDAATAVIAVETFHTPSGTKRKPICPIGHIGFYFIRYCYSHVTPPIPSAVLMPTPAYGAKCSSRFAIVR